MNDVLLTVIIPAYNVREYVADCLASVLSHGDSRVEVILIDDGSDDGTLEFVESEFAALLECGELTLIKQENAGVSAAMNRGLDVAQGRYITFLDGDDLLLDDYFPEIVPLLEAGDFDIVEHGFVRFDTKAELSSAKFEPLYRLSGAYNLDDIRNKVFSKTVWFQTIRVYRSTIWSTLRYPKGVVYEDAMTISKIFMGDHKMFYTNKPFLAYRRNPNSITAKHTMSDLRDLVAMYRAQTSDSAATRIFKVRLARSILYFHHELGGCEDTMAEILADVRSMPWHVDFCRMKLADLSFLLLTDVYIFINRLRLTKMRPRRGQNQVS